MLKEVGLVEVQPRAQQRLYELRAAAAAPSCTTGSSATAQLWDARFEQLDELIEELKAKEKSDGRKGRK